MLQRTIEVSAHLHAATQHIATQQSGQLVSTY